MKNSPLTPKMENQHTGYFFSVTDEEIAQHLSRSVNDIFSWLETANQFVYATQTPQERERSALAKTVHHEL